jgi:VanZ family protein
MGVVDGRPPGGSRFTSPRERRLWGWTLAVVVTVYATLGLASSLARLVGNGPVPSILFGLAFLVFLGAVVTQGLRSRPSAPEVGVALGIAAVYLLLFVRMSITAERTHLLEYGVVALLAHAALRERARHRTVPRPGLLAVAIAGTVGVVDELLQAVIPSRVFDPRDILFNLLAAVLAVGAAEALAWTRRRVDRLRNRG